MGLEAKTAGEALQEWQTQEKERAEHAEALRTKQWKESEIRRLKYERPELYLSLYQEVKKARTENRILDDVSRTEKAIFYRRDPDAKGA